MAKDIVAAASFYKQSYFFSPEYDELPTEVKKEVRVIAAIAAEKTRGIVCVGFIDGQVFMESSGLENDSEYDEITARAVIDQTIDEKSEFFKMLSEWYALFMTEEGRRKKDNFLKNFKEEYI